MKVLIHNRDPKLWVGGDGVQVDNTIKALKALGHEVTFTANTFTDPRAFDITHIFHINFFWTTPLMQECVLKRIPYILSAVYFDKEYDNTFGTMSKLLYKAKRVIALSNREKQEMLDRFGCDPNHIVVIPNGVDKSIFYDSDTDTNLPSKREGVIAVGRLSDRAKGAEFVINACYEMGVDCTYVGMSKDDDFSREMKSKCNHIENVSQVELAKLYNKHKVYVCSSLSERQSLGVLEAKACGCNVVDSIFNRGADFLDSSLIVDPRDSDALKMAINRQLKSFKQSDFVPDWEYVAKEIVKVYEQ